MPGDWVLDPFFGAGTVGVVCKQHNRRYVGIELNPDYVRMAVERIETAFTTASARQRKAIRRPARTAMWSAGPS
jgi:DNA modification methylase